MIKLTLAENAIAGQVSDQNGELESTFVDGQLCFELNPDSNQLSVVTETNDGLLFGIGPVDIANYCYSCDIEIKKRCQSCETGCDSCSSCSSCSSDSITIGNNDNLIASVVRNTEGCGEQTLVRPTSGSARFINCSSIRSNSMTTNVDLELDGKSMLIPTEKVIPGATYRLEYDLKFEDSRLGELWCCGTTTVIAA